MARRRAHGRGGGCGTLLVIAVVVAYLSENPNVGIGAAVLGVVALVLYVLWRRASAPKTATARELAARFGAVSAMSGAQFEIFTADLFRAMGHQATVMGRAGDQGVDVIVQYQNQRVAVQCKNYRRAVGNKPVQEVYAGAKHHGCSQAWVVAPAGHTKGAFELAKSVGVTLLDANAIRGWIKKVDAAEKQRERAA